MVAHTLSKTQQRLLGILPLAFFSAQAIHYWQINELGHMLWMCNIGNLLLAIGLFLGEATLVRVAVIWMLPGVVVWAMYVVPTWGMLLTGQMSFDQFFGVLSSTLAHLGGFSVGMLALQKVRMDGRAWFYAFIWYLVVQTFLTSLDAGCDERKSSASHPARLGAKVQFLLEILVAADGNSRSLSVDPGLRAQKALAGLDRASRHSN